MTGTAESLFARSRPFTERRFFHAAVEVLQTGLATADLVDDDLALALDEIGKAYAQLGYHHTALEYFVRAQAHAKSEMADAMCNMHAANIHRRLSDHDRAHRILQDILRIHSDLPTDVLGMIYANLASLQGQMAFYHDGIKNSHTAIRLFESVDRDHPALSFSLHTLGLLHMELRRYAEARELLHGLEQTSKTSFGLTVDIARLYMANDDIEKSITYLREAMTLVSASIFNYAKVDVAQLCYLAAQLFRSSGDAFTSRRLAQKAQLLYGQLNMWREFESLQAILDGWQTNPDTAASTYMEPEVAAELHQLLTLMDVVNAQEYLHPRMSLLLDARTLYVDALSVKVNLDAKARESLAFAARFADYGLTALELDAAANPTRSPQAWEQYQQHPNLSAKLLEPLGLGSDVLEIIRDHHEHFDGSGYPLKKSRHEVHPLALILSVADFYASSVTLDGKSHSSVLAEMKERSGSQFDPKIVAAFTEMFTPQHSG